MGRVTINGTQSQFSCKKTIPLDMWDAKGNCAKGRSREALQQNRDLDNIKAQLIKHYQHLSDKEGFVTAEMVRRSALATLCLQRMPIKAWVAIKKERGRVHTTALPSFRHVYAGVNTSV